MKINTTSAPTRRTSHPYSILTPGKEHNAQWIALGENEESARLPYGIAFPRFATSVILDLQSQGGRTFTCDLRYSTDLDEEDITFVLRNDLKEEWTCAIDEASISYGPINRGLELGWSFRVTAPPDVPPETFDLVVTLLDGTRFEEQHAVGVILDYEADFYIIQVTDQHMAGIEAKYPDGRIPDGTKKSSSELIEWAVPVLNVINPRFLLATGDNVDLLPGFEWNEARDLYREYKRAMARCNVPLFAITGNHDAFVENDGTGEKERNPHPQGTLLYEIEVGYRAFSAELGSFLLFLHDYSCSHVHRWSIEQWKKHWENRGIKYRLVGQHFHNDAHAITVEDFRDHGGYPDLVLVGHAAVTCKIVQTEPYPILITYRGQDSFKSAYFNFRKTPEGWETTEPDQHARGVNLFPLIYSGDNPFSVIKDRDLSGVDDENTIERDSLPPDKATWGRPKVEATYAHPNDGSSRANTVRIENRLPLHFYDGRIRFLMPKGDYEVSGGEVLARYDYDSSTKTAVLVKVDIQPGPDRGTSSTTTVSIGPAAG